MKDGEVSATYGYNKVSGDEFPTGVDIEQQSDSGSGMIAIPLMPTIDGYPDYGNFGLAWNKIDSNWKDDSFDTISERQQVTAAYAHQISETTSLGYSFGWTDDKFQSRAIFNYPMRKGLRHTIGAQWKASDTLSFGSSAYFGYGEHRALYGPGITGTSDTEEVGFDLGTAYQMERTLLTASLDYRHLSSDGEVVASIPANVVGGDENGNLYNVRIGAEHPINDWFDVRAGYRFAGLASYNYNRVELNDLNGSANYHAVSAGFGFNIPTHNSYIQRVDLDYGTEFRKAGDNDWQHLVTLSIPFELCSNS